MASGLAQSIPLPATVANAGPAAPPSKEIVFIDPSVRDYRTLLSGRVAGEVVVLNPDRDGVQQIADYLHGRSGIESIDIVSHGRAGAVRLGDSVLDLSAADGRSAE